MRRKRTASYRLLATFSWILIRGFANLFSSYGYSFTYREGAIYLLAVQDSEKSCKPQDAAALVNSDVFADPPLF